ncbi:MAG: hypothetical protein L6R39_006408, partial [Caloplaca ligustica]
DEDAEAIRGQQNQGDSEAEAGRAQGQEARDTREQGTSIPTLIEALKQTEEHPLEDMSWQSAASDNNNNKAKREKEEESPPTTPWSVRHVGADGESVPARDIEEEGEANEPQNPRERASLLHASNNNGAKKTWQLRLEKRMGKKKEREKERERNQGWGGEREGWRSERNHKETKLEDEKGKTPPTIQWSIRRINSGDGGDIPERGMEDKERAEARDRARTFHDPNRESWNERDKGAEARRTVTEKTYSADSKRGQRRAEREAKRKEKKAKQQAARSAKWKQRTGKTSK